MALTNVQIIETEVALRGITEEVHTFQYWKSHGFMVQKGSKALFQTEIWKPCKTKAKQEDSKQDDKQEDSKQDGKSYTKMYMVKASFFGASQVKPIEEKPSKASKAC